MNTRIQNLRNQSLNAVNKISAERALLVTAFYKSIENSHIAIPIQRAMAFEYILKHKSIGINAGELIVGERGPEPKATSTYPEINVHSLQDLNILHNRNKVAFFVDEETINAYKNIVIPYWKGKSNRDRIMQSMTGEWHDAYKAGIFTEFQEQRAPGHTVAGDKIYHLGMLDLIVQIEQQISKLNARENPEAAKKISELEAMKTCAHALILWAQRHADKLNRLADVEFDNERKKELLHMAKICTKVPANKPETFHEALQFYWFVHLGVITELNPWDAFNPGRLDQHLYPFYKKEIENGTLTQDHARELLQSFWIKFNNHPAPPKVGITALESNTYTDFALINLGGLTPEGNDAVNELSFLILDVIEEMRLLQPSSMVQISAKNPDKFIERTLHILKTGFGQPSIFNTDAIIQELVNQGKSITDARNGGASGCVESGAFGKEAYFLTGYFNLPKVLEITLNNGIDPKTGNQIGIKTGSAESYKTYQQLIDAFRIQLEHFAAIKIAGNNQIEQIFAQHMPVPFLSLIIDDCIKNGIDYVEGGARYNTSYIQGVGIGILTDCFAAIKHHVFIEQNFNMSYLLNALQCNFIGFEQLQHDLIYNSPKYGNDDNKADECLREIFELYYNAVNGKPNTRGGVHRINLLPTTCHVYFGLVTGATPDGRSAGKPLSEGISPVQGADKLGPTAVLNSAAKIDHLRTGGTLLNQKFTPSFFNEEGSIQKITALVRTYFEMNGHHIQFNVVNAQTLKDAQKHPEDHKDLIVRVAGYSDYFNDLGEDLQNEIISRTEHESFA